MLPPVARFLKDVAAKFMDVAESAMDLEMRSHFNVRDFGHRPD
jgi:hypothetical protein